MQMKIVKKQMLRVLALVLALCLITVSFVGCKKTQISNPFRSDTSEHLIDSTQLASNGDFVLEWDKDAKAVLYKHSGGEYWSDILYESYKEGLIGKNGSSPLNITVVNTKTLDWEEDVSSAIIIDGTYVNEKEETLDGGHIVTGKIKDGIRVFYFFNQYRIAIPVDYVLKNDHLQVSINTAEIMEDGTDYQLVSVGLNPNFVSVKNTDENGHLFVPSGTGAVMTAAETPDGALKHTAPVYGRDIATRDPMSYKEETDIRMPVFGAYNSNKGMLGIIESGAGSAVVNAEAANDRTGYSTIYPEFFVRGYDTFMREYYGQNIFGETKRVSDNISGQTFSVAYYPILGEETDYSAMAKKYRSYLIEKGELSKSSTVESASPYSVTFWGGTNVTKSFFGIPYKEVEALTTFNQAQEILKKLKSENGILPQVRLLGYGDNGLRPGTIAGGKSYLKEYGNKDDLNSLINYCKGTNLFLDFDIVTYSNSGNGFSVSGDVAKTAVKYKAEIFPTTPTRVNDEENAYFALGREHLSEAGEKALEKAEKYSAKAVSFSTLGQYAYSDYNDEAYINRFKIETDAKNIINSAKKAGYKTAVAEGNGYAACAADIVFDAPSTSGDYDAFTYTVPFYQMVFHSYKPMYSNGINTSSNVKKQIATAVAFGMGLGYDITDGYVSQSDDLEEFKLYATIFEDNDQKIKQTLVNDGFIDLYNSVKAATLDSYEFDGAIAKSTYSNGVVIYTNLSHKAATHSVVGELQPYEYVVE